MTRMQWLAVALALALPALGLAQFKKHIAFTDYLNSKYGVQHVNGPGEYSFIEGGSFELIVKTTATLAKSLGIRNLPNGEHLLLQHIKDDQFELRHTPTGQKASIKLALKK